MSDTAWCSAEDLTEIVVPGDLAGPLAPTQWTARFRDNVVYRYEMVYVEPDRLEKIPRRLAVLSIEDTVVPPPGKVSRLGDREIFMGSSQLTV